jgi:predicted outer membrane lipoprotein
MQIFFFFEFIGLYNNRRNWNYRIHCIWIEQLLLEKYLSRSRCKILWYPQCMCFSIINIMLFCMFESMRKQCLVKPCMKGFSWIIDSFGLQLACCFVMCSNYFKF